MRRYEKKYNDLMRRIRKYFQFTLASLLLQILTYKVEFLKMNYLHNFICYHLRTKSEDNLLFSNLVIFSNNSQCKRAYYKFYFYFQTFLFNVYFQKLFKVPLSFREPICKSFSRSNMVLSLSSHPPPFSLSFFFSRFPLGKLCTLIRKNMVLTSRM